MGCQIVVTDNFPEFKRALLRRAGDHNACFCFLFSFVCLFFFVCLFVCFCLFVCLLVLECCATGSEYFLLISLEIYHDNRIENDNS